MSILKKISESGLFIGFLDLILLTVLVFDFGFVADPVYFDFIALSIPAMLLLLIVFNLIKYRIYHYDPGIKKRARNFMLILLLLILLQSILVIINYNGNLLEVLYNERRPIEYGLLLYFFLRLTFFIRVIYSFYFNPAILFIGSFVMVIMVGTFLLLLPSATINPIGFREALFTSTSAVCVTGLLALDVSTDFTIFGQYIIMFLVQLGGLGMLTFTSFFAYFFKSGSSFKEGLFMQNVLGDDQLNGVMRTTVRIVVFSLLVELVGAVFIYDATRSLDLDHPIFFSVFHSVSAYCNGGFSTMPGNLQAPALRFNYYLHWIIMILIIFGGLGYFISFNFIKYIKQFFINLFLKKRKKSIVRIITLNTKIVVYTTLILIVGGTAALLLSEFNTVLADDQNYFGKLTTAMFSAVTARTTGFSTVDISQISVSGILIIILLMWIGASPASTGGGIKTSSFALATLNVFATARNRQYIEIGTRRVSPDAVRRAFAIIIISLISIGLGILLILTFDPHLLLLDVAFEVFSAFGTVGLSSGVASQLSAPSEYVLIFLMFFGRIGLLNLMAGMLRGLNSKSYEYPQENILIN